MLGYADHELDHKIATWATLVDPLDRNRVYQQAADYVKGKLPKFEVEFRMRHKDGHWVDILSRAKLKLNDKGEKPTGPRLIGTHVDISERKTKELQRIEQEKKQRLTLVREVHHRVKNNLQGIIGILRRYSAKYPEIATPIAQAIGQLQSIAELYGLQGQDALSRVRLGELLEIIVGETRLLWKTALNLEKSSTEPGYIICEHETVPVALILNELTVNAVKHRTGNDPVNISLTVDDMDGWVRIAFHNHGNLPADFNFNGKQHLNTGLQLVASLLPPAGAKLSFAQQGAVVAAILELQPPVLAKQI